MVLKTKKKSVATSGVVELKGKVTLGEGSTIYITANDGSLTKHTLLHDTQIEISGMANRSVETRQSPGTYRQLIISQIRRIGLEDDDD